jgi:hypothetical protein
MDAKVVELRLSQRKPSPEMSLQRKGSRVVSGGIGDDCVRVLFSTDSGNAYCLSHSERVWTGCKDGFVVVLLRAAGVIVAPARCGSCRLRSYVHSSASSWIRWTSEKKYSYNEIVGRADC